MTKISQHGDNLLATSGKGSVALELQAWWIAGADVKEFPASARGEDGGNLIVITKDRRVLQFGTGPIPAEMQGRFYVVGVGGDIALAAMHCGRTAAEAVALACELNSTCGNGIDTLELGSNASTGACRSGTNSGGPGAPTNAQRTELATWQGGPR